MKILHAAETIKGGVSTVINSLIKNHIENPQVDKIMVICPYDQKDSLIKTSKLNVCLFARKKRNILGLINFMIVFTKILMKEKPDIVHLHSSFAGLIGRLLILSFFKFKKIKVIYCPHAFSFLMSTNILKKTLYAYMEFFLSFITDKIICVSKSEYLLAIQKNLPKSKLSVIHNGVPIKIEVKNNNLNKQDHYKLLFVGRFDYQKGLDILLKSLSKVDKKLINYKITLTLVGETVNNNENIEFPSSLKNINMVKKGWLNSKELEKQYLINDLLVIPSRWEGFAMVPLEAMSYGLPIIASDIEAFKEIIVHNENGLLFKNENHESLENVLINLHELNLNVIRDRALNNFTNKYTEELMNTKTFNLYLDILKK